MILMVFSVVLKGVIERWLRALVFELSPIAIVGLLLSLALFNIASGSCDGEHHAIIWLCNVS